MDSPTPTPTTTNPPPSPPTTSHYDYSKPLTTTPVETPESLSHLSTAILSSKLENLRSVSAALTSTLTSKLASSQSLLHIGPSLSTLPPDLKTIVDVVGPMSEEVRVWNGKLEEERETIRKAVEMVEAERRRGVEGEEAAVLLGDLAAVEGLLFGKGGEAGGGGGGEGKEGFGDDEDNDNDDDEKLHHAASLERAAHTCLHLLHHLHNASAQVTSSTTTTPRPTSANSSPTNRYSVEMAQFILRLAPRIRKLETQTISKVSQCLESIMAERMERRKRKRREEQHADDGEEEKSPVKKDHHNSNDDEDEDAILTQQESIIIGHYLRSLTLLSHVSDAESIFATAGIMPLIRRNLSISRLDEGGPRGSCSGLSGWLEGVVEDVRVEWGDILRLGEGMFGDLVVEGEEDGEGGERMDLVCGGVWVPIATALMTDPTVRMAIFSPGIASVLQANYVALDTFLSQLASKLLRPHLIPQQQHPISPTNTKNTTNTSINPLSQYYYQPKMTDRTITTAQSRLYRHRTTINFFKKWNLPIYYQLRFGEACSRLDKVIAATTVSGWWYNDGTKTKKDGESGTDTKKLELAVFVELNSILDWLWQDDVFLCPLTNRFLRGAIQLIGRVVGFVRDGLDGKIEFGGTGGDDDNAAVSLDSGDKTEGKGMGIETTYRWVDRIEDVAVVSWELSLLQSYISQEYVSTICQKVTSSTTTDSAEDVELNTHITKLLTTTLCSDLTFLINTMWNDRIVIILTARCTAPLSAVKGVAATYRMTNRPPPTQASPFVHTILRPVREFISSYAAERTPSQIGHVGWKVQIVSTVAKDYAVAVSELIETVQRTEEALKNRKTRMNRGGMAGGGSGRLTDGEKVKLQLYLDREEFVRCVEEVGVDSEKVEGVLELKRLTDSAEGLYRKITSTQS